MSKFVFGKRSKVKLYGDDTISGVRPIVAKLCCKALLYSTVDFSIIDGFRSERTQHDMFVNHRSELDGYEKLSDHQYGMAIDVIPVIHYEGKKLNPFDTENIHVARAWLEVYRAFMRAAMKLHLVVEFGFGYNVGGGRDWPHISVKGKAPKHFSGLAK